MTDDEVQSNRWHWIRMSWGAVPGPKGQLIPALPYRDEHGRIEHWGTIEGKVWTRPKNGHSDGFCWYVDEVISVITDPEEPRWLPPTTFWVLIRDGSGTVREEHLCPDVGRAQSVFIDVLAAGLDPGWQIEIRRG